MLIRCEIAKREKFEIEKGIHRYNSLVIVLSGEFEYTTKNTTQKIHPLEPVFFKKGDSFFKRVISPIKFIIISSLQFSFESDYIYDSDNKNKERLKNTVEHLIKAIKRDAPDNIKEHFVNDIFLTSAKNTGKIVENNLLPAYEYINKNFSKKLSLNLLAKINCCSVQTLITRFRKHTGKTPTEYITELRIKTAKDFLINTDYSIGQISELCGYENTYYFSNVFKSEVGLSPSNFRKSSMM